MQALHANRAVMAALGMLIGLTACNKKEVAKAATPQEVAPAAVPDSQAKTSTAAMEGHRADSGAKASTDGKGLLGDIERETRQTARDLDQAARNSVALIKGARPGDSGSTDADRQLIARIRGTLSKHKSVSAEVDGIAIRSNGGKVTLKGAVSTEAIRKDMAKHVGEVGEVKGVANDLIVAERVGAGSSD